MSYPALFRRVPRWWPAPFALAALGLVAFLLAGTSWTPAAASLLPAGAVAPTAQQRELAPRIASILEHDHDPRVRFDAQLSPAVFDRYLDMLDGQHSYFLASDIKDFGKWRTKFGHMIRSGQLDPAYAIFAVFERRNRERMDYALKQLDHEPDWNNDLTYRFDRSHASWPANMAAMNALWHRRVMNDEISLMLTGKTWPQAVKILRKRYQYVLDRLKKVEPEDVFETLMNAYTSALDPHTDYFSPSSSEEYRIEMSLSYQGIGASLEQNNDYVTVSSILPGGPAQAAGTLKINDRITAVGQGRTGKLVDVIGWRLDDVVQLIRGKEGSVVRLQILPAGAPPGGAEHVIDLTRHKITLKNQEAKKQVRTVTHDGRSYKIGIIKVPSFYAASNDANNPNSHSTVHDVHRLLEELKAEGGVNGLILDLRGDGGGYLPQAIGLTHLFINHGPVVQLRDASGHVEVLDQPDPGQAYTGPLAVLVDRSSASASEIFAGAIQDYHRGLIIGQRTFGKGTVQSVIPLDRWSAAPTEGQITVTIGKFYRVTGQSTQRRGVIPDITLASPISPRELGESMLPHALPWDRISPARFTPLPSQAALIKTLALEQSNRASHSAEYHWWEESLALLRQERHDHVLPLNLAKRKAQLAAQNAERLADENARRTAKGLPALKSVASIKAGQEPDVMLDQAVDIVTDWVASRHARAPLQHVAATHTLQSFNAAASRTAPRYPH